MTKEETKEFQKEFEIVNNQVRKQVDERNIIKGKLLAFDLITNYLIKKQEEYENDYTYWRSELKKEKTSSSKKDIQAFIDRSEGTSVNLHFILEQLEKMKTDIATDFFK